MKTKNGQVSTAQILSLFGKGGVLMFGRRCNTLPAEAGQTDRDRQLSPIGCGQVVLIARKLVDRKFDLVLSSPAERARTTTAVITGRRDRDIGTVTTFGISEDPSEPLNVMFNLLKYAPLSEYYKHELAEHLHEFGHVALAEILSLVAAVKADGTARVFVGGHAVLHPQVMYTLGEFIRQGGYEVGRVLQSYAEGATMGEGEVVILTFSSVGNTLTGIGFESIKP